MYGKIMIDRVVAERFRRYANIVSGESAAHLADRIKATDDSEELSYLIDKAQEVEREAFKAKHEILETVVPWETASEQHQRRVREREQCQGT